MLIGKQVDRLVAKVMRLGTVYEPFLITEILSPSVTLTENGVSRPITAGDSWGGEFCVSRFSFTAQGITPGKKYRLFADTGAVEHQIAVNGYSVGMLDHIDHASEPMFRIHRYVWLQGLQNGDTVTLDGYYSHTFPNTMPYDGTFTFGLDGQRIHLPGQELQETWVQSLDQEDPLEEDIAIQSSFLAWRTPQRSLTGYSS